MKTLEKISIHPWFVAEFKIANGQVLLPWCVFEDTLWLEEALEVIYKTLPSLNLYQDLNLWIECIRICLISTGISLNGSWRARGRMMEYASENVCLLISRLHNMVDRWGVDREYMPYDGDAATTRASSIIGDTQPPNHDDLPVCDARIWSTEEWESLQTTIEEVIPGLERGYIMEGPTAGWQRFARDSESICFHARHTG